MFGNMLVSVSVLLVLELISHTGCDICSKDSCRILQSQENHENQEYQEQEREARVKRMAFYRNGKEVAGQVSDTLDILLDKDRYNRQMRPPGENLDTSPVQVQINMAIRSMGPVDEVRELFSLDCYFRQSWTDTRLRFNTTGISELVLDWQFLTKIWKPDTTFLNGQKCYLHKITVPNRFIRISPSGRVSYSQRLTLWSKCPMYLGKFPFDSQSCSLEIGSYGYTSDDLTYEWALKPVSIDDLGLAQYHMTDLNYGVQTSPTKRKISSGFRTDSVAFLRFDFQRQSGFFLLGIYFPLTLIVMCSWVSFWIVKTDVPSRVSLGVTSLLSVTKVGFGGKAKPQIGYATALDVYTIICFFFSFAALLEFALINFIDTYFKRLKQWEQDNPEQARKRRDRFKRASSDLSSPPTSGSVLPPDHSSISKSSPKMAPDSSTTTSVSLGLAESPALNTTSFIPTPGQHDLTDPTPGLHTASSPCQDETQCGLRYRKDVKLDILELSDQNGKESNIEDDIKSRESIQSSTKPSLTNIIYSEGMVAVLEKIRGYIHYLRRIKSSFFPIWRHFALEGELGYEETQYVVDRIDEISRILFPAGFMLISFIYWSYYLYSE
ncbi:gamma-aminobutyric acid receptor subunit alpha-6 isoform X3 [Eurytemora carolleeae]|uniref:gamma-aminobutyric acid receptor subunit alpha-6 isoform X3 n=1 Tax=Eurytemora carolleeae TaxID=1294199 RepID=UPI000C783FC8|nr:gamma-aminobutyric acid receptor subunit alpha-6 isoform X3 [Eurytemora carolleeae]|eukprot:XP_023321281.1 gamma-aminobutyric acid receptor subunit alpha-6-like isoform X3 [Eurytemora affinis]